MRRCGLNWRLLYRLQERGGRHPLYGGGCLVLMLLPNWARFEPNHPKERPVHSELDAVPHRDAHRLREALPVQICSVAGAKVRHQPRPLAVGDLCVPPRHHRVL